MSWEGRFAAAKKVALAMESLVRSLHPRDYFGIVGFFTRAVELKAKDLPQATWNMGDPFTNLQDGLHLATEMLGKKPSANQQMIVITDGQPTAYCRQGRLYCEWPLSFGGISQRAAEDVGARTTIQAVGYAGRFVLWSLLFVTGLDHFGIQVTALVTGLGVGGIAVALAVQNILGDLFAALAIVLDKPFVVGDFIIVDNVLGTVEHVGLKTTRLRSLSGEQIIMSNNDLLKSRIRNFKRMEQRRIVFSIDVTYDTSPEKVMRIPGMIREVIEAQERTRFDRSHFLTFAESSLRIETVYFVLSSAFNDYADTQHAINVELLRRFNADGIEFAFPTRTLYHMGQGEASSPLTPAT